VNKTKKVILSLVLVTIFLLTSICAYADGEIITEQKIRSERVKLNEEYYLGDSDNLHIDFSNNISIKKEREAKAVVLVLDTSGSMKNGNKLKTLKRASKQFVKQSFGPRKKVSIGVVEFNKSASVVQEITENNTIKNSKKLKDSIDTIVAKSDKTNVGAGLEEALKMLKEKTNIKDENKYIVTFSDGKDNVDKPNTIEVAKKIAAEKINALFVEDKDTKKLEAIAVAAGAEEVEDGKHYYKNAFVNNAIIKIFDFLASVIAEEYIVEKAELQEVLPLGVDVVEANLPEGFTAEKHSKGRWVVKGEIKDLKFIRDEKTSNFSLQHPGIDINVKFNKVGTMIFGNKLIKLRCKLTYSDPVITGGEEKVSITKVPFKVVVKEKEDIVICSESPKPSVVEVSTEPVESPQVTTEDLKTEKPVSDKEGTEYPKTGESSTYFYLIAGIALMAAGLVAMKKFGVQKG
jgi:LPXTG-motif cell wall-anchored protein